MATKLKLPEVISQEQLNKILNNTKKPNHKISFALGFYQCMRVSEVVNLQEKDINTKTKILHIRQAKGGKDRMIPIAPEVLRGLKNIPVGVGVRALQKSFKKQTIEVLKRDDLHFHSLRHSGITFYLTKKKWSSLEVQRLAGHSKIATTEIYTHINPEDLVNRMWE